jgi:hypothetical protein
VPGDNCGISTGSTGSFAEFLFWKYLAAIAS